MIALALAALLSASPVQDAPTQATPTTEDTAVRLEDVEVTGRSLESMIDNFVVSVAASNPNRSLARWRNAVCVGAVNLQPDVAHHLVDRVSTIAGDIGLTPGAPGCTPNVLILATDDASGLSQVLVQQHRRALRMGGTGTDRGRTALHDFQMSDRPVRWWQVSMPVDDQTGALATRLPGNCRAPCGKTTPGDESSHFFAPIIAVSSASRLSTQIVDDLIKTFVVVDVNHLNSITADQLADYIAMITFAQIDPQADTRGYATILNVFEEPDSVSSLTEWDKAYLTGLYNTVRTRKNLNSARTEVASSIRRAHERLRAENPSQD